MFVYCIEASFPKRYCLGYRWVKATCADRTFRCRCCLKKLSYNRVQERDCTLGDRPLQARFCSIVLTIDNESTEIRSRKYFLLEGDHSMVSCRNSVF
jgi:hypothetical protein